MPSSQSPLSLDDILEELTAIASHAKDIEARRQSLLDALDQLVENGQAQDKHTWNDYTITRRSRTTYSYPDYIKEQREQLKASEQLSVALGEATLKTTTFWEVRAPKS